ncbi:unnamed protein product [Heterobilharzia americana]|nr:unnamed protein product [Heterobilharzia americana]
MCCNSDQLVIGQDKKSLVGNQSVCPDDSSTRDSFSQSVTGYPIISCQTPVANSQETNVIMIASSNTSSLQTQSGEFLVNPGPVETRHTHENVTKEVNPDIVHLDNEKGAWIWEGKSFVKPIFYQSDSPPVLCKCYPAIRHRRDGMVIRAKDSVLLCSGPSRSHPPHVAKIVALYHDKNTDTKMMSLLWYYRPEHTNSTAQNFVKNELYASRHRDTNPLDCIEDKAFVLSVNAYSRYMAKLKRQQMGYRKMPLSSIVPQFGSCSLHGNKSPEDNLYMDKYPLSECDECFNSTNSQSVFFCRGLYDYKLKRVTRYPVFANQYLLSHSANRQKSNGQSFTTPQKQSTEQNNVTSLNEDCCSGTTTPSKQDASPGILNTIEPVTPLRDNVPFKVFSTPTTSTMRMSIT